MALTAQAASRPLPSEGPALILVQGEERRTFVIGHSPFTVGRKADKDLVIADPRVSRDHASIVTDGDSVFIVDQGSKHGTFVNGERVLRKDLQPNDRLEFGARDAAYAVFQPTQTSSNATREFLHQVQLSTSATDLERLTLFLQAACKLNATGVLEEILVILLDVTLKLTGADRAYVFLKNNAGHLRLRAGRNSKGDVLSDDKTISQSILEDALVSNSEFLITDTSESFDISGRNSIVAFDLRTVICIPLRKPQVHATRVPGASVGVGEVMGALYVDSRMATRSMSSVSNDILHAIAIEAASLIENARLVQAEEASRRYQQELSIAATIQQRLMAVTVPEVAFARLDPKNVPCKEIGGDFYDVVMTKDGLAFVLADVSGKGVSAALLASTLQGMVYSQLSAGMGLVDIVTGVNRFFTHKEIGEKYATLIIALVRQNGELEYVNCGHVPPLLVSGGSVSRPSHGNLPVGLLADAIYKSDRVVLHAGDRFVVVTDGVTEAENAKGEFFDDLRLENAIKRGGPEMVFSALADFCAGIPLGDDCTVVDLQYCGESGPGDTSLGASTEGHFGPHLP